MSEKRFNMDNKTHEILKIESAKRKISMKKLVHNAVIEYFERHKIEQTDLPPAKKTPKKEESIMDFINNEKLVKKIE